MLVIDSMHCILEGLVHYHCCYVIGLDAAEAKEVDRRVSAFTYPWTLWENNMDPKYQEFDEKDRKQVTLIQNLLEQPLGCDPDPLDETQLHKRLLNRLKAPLSYVADDLNLLETKVRDNTGTLVPATMKEHIVTLLVNWVCHKSRFNNQCTHTFHQCLQLPVSPPPKVTPKTCDMSTLCYVQHVIQTTDTPSWIHSVPLNYGEASVGIIKAGEWRILSTIHIPIALTTLWGKEGIPNQPHFLKLLNHSMALFEAVTLVVHNTITPAWASRYRLLLREWVDGLYKVHPHTAAYPKHTNIHAAFHIYDFLLLFGPVMLWWTFPL